MADHDTSKDRNETDGGNTPEMEAPVNPADHDTRRAVLEALLFAAGEPLNEAEISQSIPDLLEAEVAPLIDSLEAHYQSHPHGLTVQRVAGGWRLATRAEYADVVRQHLRGKVKGRLSRASLETVSIIAYRQPVSRSEVEQMRGVDCSPVIRNLLERGLIKVAGRADAPGRPLLYSTTESFLEYFGLDSLSSLPKPEEILGEPEEEEAGVAMPVRRGPFAGADAGVDQETYRTDYSRSEIREPDEGEAPLPDDEPDEDQAPIPGGDDAADDDHEG